MVINITFIITIDKDKPLLANYTTEGNTFLQCTPLRATITPLWATNTPLWATNTPLWATNTPLWATNTPL